MLENFQNQAFAEHLYALVLAGGGGTRLWPKSRNKTPKQFLRLFQGQTLTQMTITRLRQILPWKKIFIVTVSEEYKAEILKEIPEFEPANIIVEPARRETGPAHGLGALFISKKDSDAVILTEAVDRLVDPVEVYLKTLFAAAKVAYKEKVMVAMGVTPRYAHTGLGHIKKGEKITEVQGITFYNLAEFKEKPPQELAEAYTASGEYFWNAGQFVWRADTLLNSLKINAPDVYLHLENIGRKIGASDEKIIVKKEYEQMPAISIDCAVAEKDKNFYVVHGEFHWTDIGDWKEVWENLPKDENRNVVINDGFSGGRFMNIDSSDSLVYLNNRLIALVDIDDIAVIDTEEILLICKKSRSQSVKKLVEELKAEGNTKLL